MFKTSSDALLAIAQNLEKRVATKEEYEAQFGEGATPEAFSNAFAGIKDLTDKQLIHFAELMNHLVKMDKNYGRRQAASGTKFTVILGLLLSLLGKAVEQSEDSAMRQSLTEVKTKIEQMKSNTEHGD